MRVAGVGEQPPFGLCQRLGRPASHGPLVSAGTSHGERGRVDVHFLSVSVETNASKYFLTSSYSGRLNSASLMASIPWNSER